MKFLDRIRQRLTGAEDTSQGPVGLGQMDLDPKDETTRQGRRRSGSMARMKRGVGYCENTECEDYAKGVFLLNHGDTFYCPRCRQLGKVEKERGFYTGNSDIFKEVRVEYNFDPVHGIYREIAIVRDESLWGRNNVYTLQSPLIKTEKRALKVAEAILANLNRYRGLLNGDDIPRTTEIILSFDDDMDEFIYMAGLLSGLQALNAQIQSTSSIGVPANVGSIAARATSCLDNEKWWGAPMALRATVWAMIPGAQPEGENAFERLAIADDQGEVAGVRLPHVFHAIAALNKGDEAMVRSVIRDHAESIETTPANEQWRFVDAMATDMIVAVSDRLWVENTGHRTPMGQLGSFWDDQAEAVETMDLDDLL